MKNRVKIVIISLIVLFCLLTTYYFHFILKIDQAFSHIFYIPILISSIWWRRTGIYIAIFLSIFLVCSQFISDLGVRVIDIVRTVIFIIVAVTTTYLMNKIKDNNIKLLKQYKELEYAKIAKEKSEESERIKSAFLANMSHEIRTPMTGILGFVSLLQEPNLNGEEQQKYIKIIDKSGKRLLNIINDIISISKVDSGMLNVNISESNINEQVEFIYNFFKAETNKKGINLTYNNQLSSSEAIVKTDNEKLYAILTNLIKNAIKFTLEGSIDFGYSKKGNFLEFYVKDTGVGINFKTKEHIFERFMQGSDSLSREYEGAGLGLSISKAYVEMLGGKIWAESIEGMGSEFYFTIPYIV